MAELKTWSDFHRHASYWRKEVKKSFGDPLAQFKFVREIVIDGKKRYNVLLALGSIQGGNERTAAGFQTIVYGELFEGNEDLVLKPLFTAEDFGAAAESSKPSPELQLHYERMRGQICFGVTNFSVGDSGKLLISTATRLYCYQDGKLMGLCGWTKKEPMNAQMAPCNSDYVAFVSHGKLYIDKNGEKAFETEDDEPGIICGVPAFVTQEELERDKGFWWSPTRLELIYEKVNEAEVDELSFSTPGKPEQIPMKYPRVGTKNAVSDLHLVRFNEETNEFEDKMLLIELNELTPFEYIARVDWDSKGETLYVIVMDRLQNQLSVILLGRLCFLSKDDDDHLPVMVLRTEESPIWVNHNNLTHLQDIDRINEYLAMVYGSEKNDKCHLYRAEFRISLTEKKDTRITAGDWTILKESPLVIDSKRDQYYFLANYDDVTKTQLCVCFNEENSRVKALTPKELCYKFDRCDSEICVNPEIGFVCWLSSIKRLPECHFYALKHSPGELPSAVFQYRIKMEPQPSPLDLIQPMSPSAMSVDSQPGSSNLTDIFRHSFHQVQLPSGEITYSLVLLPACAPAPFPVVHYVYAGPGLQIVKDSWATVSQFLKFVTAGYAVVLIDGRGSANRGIAFEGAIKNKLGAVEVEDQVYVLKVVASRVHELDLKRVVVTGWSYGGYMSLRMLALHPNVYKAACAGGAVVDWKLYDTCYTERYMGITDPESNYSRANVMSLVDKLPEDDGRLMIVHGLIDENVHFFHTEKLISYLVQYKKPHQLLLFPNERHGVRKAEAIEYLHAGMLVFFRKALSY